MPLEKIPEIPIVAVVNLDAAPHTISLFKKILRRLQPTENINIAEWADKYRRLPAESSAEPGQWRTSRTPYLQRPMECISDPKIHKVILMFSAQVGKTEVLLNVMGYYTHIDPSPILIVHPTKEMGQDFSKERIAPTIRDTPVLRSAIGVEKSRDAKNTLMKKFFPGGYIAIVGANSPVGLASRPIKILLADEIDRWPESAHKEGDPLSIVEARTKTYPYTHKKVYTSTPTIDGISRIQHEYNQGSMEKWKLPCPGCGAYHDLQWANIKFEHMYDSETKQLDESQDVLCVCTACGLLSNEMAWKNGCGMWDSLKPDSDIKSFHMNALSSPWTSWLDILKNFLSSKDDTEMLKVWTNTEMGEPWLDDGESIDFSALYKRRVDYGTTIPKDVLVITAGVDVQDDRFEVEVVGWGENKVSWGLEYKIIRGHGNTSLPEMWELLDQHLLKKYTCADGAVLPITTTCIDSGGHRTPEVYAFCKRRANRGVWAIKGKGGPGMNIIHNVSRTKKIKNHLVIVAVDTAKSTMFTRLAQTEPDKAGYCHFPIDTDTVRRGYDEKYFEGLTSEVKVVKMVRGRPKTEWKVKTGVHNEPLDCRVYNIAAIELLSPTFEELKRRRSAGAPKPKRRRGTMSGGIEV